MNILIATQNAPLYLAEFLEKFINIWIKNEQGSITIFRASPYVENNILKELKKRYRLYGLISFIKMSIFIAYNIFLSYLNNIRIIKKCYSVDNVIKKYSLVEFSSNSINSSELINYVNNKKIDLIISIAFPEIFKSEILYTPKHGCINYHTALLPKYRGRQPLFWALFNNEKETGITIHKMDKNIDKGMIILQQSISIENIDTINNLYKKTIGVGPELLYQATIKLRNNKENFINKKNTKEKLYNFPNAKDGLKFRQNGKKFI